MKTGWIITKDHFGEGKEGTNSNAVGVMGPGDYEGDGSELKIEFRMYCDDGELVYEGRMSREDFDPLDDFGAPNFGCTRLDYFNTTTNQWEIL
jgi:hypothetical protein